MQLCLCLCGGHLQLPMFKIGRLCLNQMCHPAFCILNRSTLFTPGFFVTALYTTGEQATAIQPQSVCRGLAQLRCLNMLCTVIPSLKDQSAAPWSKLLSGNQATDANPEHWGKETVPPNALHCLFLRFPKTHTNGTC